MTRINVGCGEFPAPGWLNLDAWHDAADLRWNAVDGLPELERVDRIYAGHVLEHLPRGEVSAVLVRWREHPGVHAGTVLAVVGPDCDRAEAMHAAGELSAEELRGAVEGACRWPGDAHLWRSTGPATAELLAGAGWVARRATLERIAADGWPVTSLARWQLGYLARPAR